MLNGRLVNGISMLKSQACDISAVNSHGGICYGKNQKPQCRVPTHPIHAHHCSASLAIMTSNSFFNEEYVSLKLNSPTTRNASVAPAKAIGSQKSTTDLYKSISQHNDRKVDTMYPRNVTNIPILKYRGNFLNPSILSIKPLKYGISCCKLLVFSFFALPLNSFIDARSILLLSSNSLRDIGRIKL